MHVTRHSRVQALPTRGLTSDDLHSPGCWSLRSLCMQDSARLPVSPCVKATAGRGSKPSSEKAGRAVRPQQDVSCHTPLQPSPPLPSRNERRVPGKRAAASQTELEEGGPGQAATNAAASAGNASTRAPPEGPARETTAQQHAPDHRPADRVGSGNLTVCDASAWRAPPARARARRTCRDRDPLPPPPLPLAGGRPREPLPPPSLAYFVRPRRARPNVPFLRRSRTVQAIIPGNKLLLLLLLLLPVWNVFSVIMS